MSLKRRKTEEESNSPEPEKPSEYGSKFELPRFSREFLLGRIRCESKAYQILIKLNRDIIFKSLSRIFVENDPNIINDIFYKNLILCDDYFHDNDYFPTIEIFDKYLSYSLNIDNLEIFSSYHRYFPDPRYIISCQEEPDIFEKRLRFFKEHWWGHENFHVKLPQTDHYKRKDILECFDKVGIKVGQWTKIIRKRERIPLENLKL